MNGQFERVPSSIRAAVREMRREDITFMAASIAYHALVSLLPILLLLSLVLSATGRGRFVGTVVRLTTVFLPEAGQQVVANALGGATGNVGLSVVSVGVLLWGTSKIFRAMDAAFAQIYDTERKLSLVGQFSDALIVVLAVGGAAVVAVLFGSVVAVPDGVPFSWALDGLVAVLGLTVAFFPMYYVFPNIDVSVREVLPGVLVAAVGWTSLEWLFHLYASASSKPDIYGLLGTVLLLVTWLYVGGLVLLAGASVNATLSGRDGDPTTQRPGKRQFGREVRDVESFENRLDRLVAQADDADVSAADLREALRRRAEAVGDARSDESPETVGSDERSRGA